jgi:hypothetical protein
MVNSAPVADFSSSPAHPTVLKAYLVCQQDRRELNDLFQIGRAKSPSCNSYKHVLPESTRNK